MDNIATVFKLRDTSATSFSCIIITKRRYTTGELWILHYNKKIKQKVKQLSDNSMYTSLMVIVKLQLSQKSNLQYSCDVFSHIRWFTEKWKSARGVIKNP